MSDTKRAAIEASHTAKVALQNAQALIEATWPDTVASVLASHRREDLAAAIVTCLDRITDMERRFADWMRLPDQDFFQPELRADINQYGALFSEFNEHVKTVLGLIKENRETKTLSPVDAQRLDKLSAALTQVYDIIERAYVRHEREAQS